MSKVKKINQALLVTSIVLALFNLPGIASPASLGNSAVSNPQQIGNLKQTISSIKPVNKAKPIVNNVTPKNASTKQVCKTQKTANSSSLAKKTNQIAVKNQQHLKSSVAQKAKKIISISNIKSSNAKIKVTTDIKTSSNKTATIVTKSGNSKKSSKLLGLHKLYYKTFTAVAGEPKFAIVYFDNKEVGRYMETVAGFTPEARAKTLVARLKSFIQTKGNPNTVLPGIDKGTAVGRANGDILFTVDNKTAAFKKQTAFELSVEWVNNIRTSLGTQKFVRNNTLIASRGVSAGFSRSSLLSNSSLFSKDGLSGILRQTGIASWYGAAFHGRRAADGSVFNMHAFTAAHKTLPLGSVVKVTNLRNGKSCLVKITDRGPFIPGRVIDLSSAAAKEIGMLSSGVSKVKVEVTN